MRDYIQQIEEQKNIYLEQIRQKEDELNEFKQNAIIERDEMIKASREEIKDIANAKHNRILSEKDKEMQELKEKYSELEKKYNEAYENIPRYITREATKLSMTAIGKKDREIQRLQEQLNQLLSQQTSQGTEMEMEEPKTRPERIEVEENKQEIIPRQGMQTRSQGPPSYGEKFHQEEYDPFGNLTWKGNIYSIPNMGDYKAYDVVINLLQKASGDNKNFKMNFVNYAKGKEGDRINYDTKDNMGYITKAIEILGNELNNDNRGIAIAMKHIIENNPKVYAGFKNIYENRYAWYLKK